MLDLKQRGRNALGGALKVARTPADLVLDRAPENRITSSVRQVLDRADAAARGTAGTVLGDEELKREAERGFEASDKRAEADRLRAEAEAKRARGESTAAEREREAEKRRKRAAREAEQKKQKARERAAEQKKAASKQAEKRKEAARKQAAKQRQQIKEKAEEERVEVLEAKRDALAEQEEAAGAASESRRLKDAAERVKAERKTEDGKLGSANGAGADSPRTKPGLDTGK